MRKTKHSDTKRCRDCGETKPLDDFVKFDGTSSRGGTRCQSCYRKESLRHISDLTGGYTECPYCGQDLSAPSVTVHYDHMEPRSRGGWDHPCNMAYCCSTCNLKKSNKLFREWIEEIPEKYRDRAIDLYKSRLVFSPEDFFPIDADREQGVVLSFRIDIQEDASILTRPGTSTGRERPEQGESYIDSETHYIIDDTAKEDRFPICMDDGEGFCWIRSYAHFPIRSPS
jgi:hypothetical protein